MQSATEAKSWSYSQEAFWSLSVGVPTAILILRLWVEAGGSLQVTLVLAANVSPVSLITVIVTTGSWLFSTIVVTVLAIHAVLYRSDPGYVERHSFMNWVTSGAPWFRLSAFALALLTWDVLYLPLLLLCAVAVFWPRRRPAGRSVTDTTAEAATTGKSAETEAIAATGIADATEATGKADAIGKAAETEAIGVADATGKTAEPAEADGTGKTDATARRIQARHAARGVRSTQTAQVGRWRGAWPWLPPLGAVVAFVLLWPTLQTAYNAGQWIPLLVLTVPLAALLLGAPGPIAARAVPAVLVGAKIVMVALLAMALRPALTGPILPLVVIIVKDSAGYAAPERGHVISVDDTTTTVLRENGGIDYVPNERVEGRILCPDEKDIPRYRLWLYGVHVEDSILQAIGRSHRSEPVDDPWCRAALHPSSSGSGGP